MLAMLLPPTREPPDPPGAGEDTATLLARALNEIAVGAGSLGMCRNSPIFCRKMDSIK